MVIPFPISHLTPSHSRYLLVFITRTICLTFFIIMAIPFDPLNDNPRQMPELWRIAYKPDLLPNLVRSVGDILVLCLALVPDPAPVL
jgi:hypothetical protein